MRCPECGRERNKRGQPYTVFGLRVHLLQTHRDKYDRRIRAIADALEGQRC